jgi:hypothetical protein
VDGTGAGGDQLGQFVEPDIATVVFLERTAGSVAASIDREDQGIEKVRVVVVKRRIDENVETMPFHACLRREYTASTALRISRTVIPRGLTGGSAMRMPMKRPSWLRFTPFDGLRTLSARFLPFAMDGLYHNRLCC